MNKSRGGLLVFLLFSAVAIPLLAIALQKFAVFTPNAAGAVPQMITLANLTDTTATISWTTPAGGTITNLQWGESTSLGKTESDFRDKRDKTTKSRTTHIVQLTGLQANTTYYYRIISGSNTYPSSDQLASTFSTISRPEKSQPTALTLYGDIANQDTDVIITAYVMSGNGFSNTIPLTTTLNVDGTWFVNVSAALTRTGTYITPNGNTQVAIVSAGTNGLGYVGQKTAAGSPYSLEIQTTLTQSALDEVLGNLNITPSVTTTVSTTPTITPTKRQDVPLRPATSGTVTVTPTGTITATVTPTPTVLTADITKDELLSSFVSPSVSNVTDSSLSIMYVTTSAVANTLNYGKTATSLTSNKLNDQDSASATPRYIHHYTLTGLTSNAQYFFKPTDDSTIRTFTLPAKIAALSGQTLLNGTLTNASGECLVRTQIKRDSILSSVITTLPNESHSWLVNITPVRTAALDTFMAPAASDEVLTNAFCITSSGDVWYGSDATTVQNAATSGTSLTLVKLQ